MTIDDYRTRKTLRRLRRIGIAAAAVVAGNLVFFELVAPAIKSARLESTARKLARQLALDPAGLDRLAGSGRPVFGGSAGLWSLRLAPGTAPDMDAARLDLAVGSARAEAARALGAQIAANAPGVSGDLTGADIWQGRRRLGAGTFCAARRCAITVTRAGDVVYLAIADRL
ncbi:MAG: hypothetical protein ACWA5A_14480 [Marinibacterium sp.]